MEIRRHLTLRGWSQRQLAKTARIDPGDLSKMLSGQKTPSPAQLSRIDAALHAGGKVADADVPRARAAVPRRRLTGADAAAVRSTLATFRQLDNQSGGAHVHHLAAAYLDRTVAPMLRDGTYSESDGRDLFGAAAQVAHVAAWTAYDNGDARGAEKYFARALELAAAAGDGTFTGEVLAARSHRAVHLGIPDRAVDLARAARHAGGSGTPALTAEAMELEANALALLGDRSGCLASLAACEQAFARAAPDSTPEWLGYFDRSYLSARTAHTLRDLGDWEAAREHAAEAARMALPRAQVFNVLIVATTWVEDDRDAATVTGRQALTMTAGMQSGRASAYTKDLRRRLRRRYGSGDPEVALFDEECRELLGS